MGDYNWTLKEAKFTKDKGKVFSCFAGGGGSTMGYKLSGFDVIGCNEIDPKMMEVYRLNHSPEHSFLESIQTFKDRDDLPSELYDLDILDGSPPCSSFSMAGNREKDWGKKKKFREGQAVQVLDTLFFDFIELAKKLQPKVVVAENVKGIILGNAKAYVRKIYKDFDRAGYVLQHFLLNAADMGVPQRRERVFFIGLRKDLVKQFMYNVDLFNSLPFVNMDFNADWVKYGEFADDKYGKELTFRKLECWIDRRENEQDMGWSYARLYKKEGYFTFKYAYPDKTPLTIGAHKDSTPCRVDVKREISNRDICLIGSFPTDYNFNGIRPGYVVGMSVPPLMSKGVADRIWKYWLSKL